MSLPKPTPQYSMEDQSVTRGQIDKVLNTKVSKGEIQDKIYMRDTVTGETVTLTVASGVLVIT